MRKNILSFKLLSDKAMFMPSNSKYLNVNKCNVILFGPSGSGKSSFIKSLYRSLYNSIYLPPEAVKKLIIKNTDENEGTYFMLYASSFKRRKQIIKWNYNV